MILQQGLVKFIYLKLFLSLCFGGSLFGGVEQKLPLGVAEVQAAPSKVDQKKIQEEKVKKLNRNRRLAAQILAVLSGSAIVAFALHKAKEKFVDEPLEKAKTEKRDLEAKLAQKEKDAKLALETEIAKKDAEQAKLKTDLQAQMELEKQTLKEAAEKEKKKIEDDSKKSLQQLQAEKTALEAEKARQATEQARLKVESEKKIGDLEKELEQRKADSLASKTVVIQKKLKPILEDLKDLDSVTINDFDVALKETDIVKKKDSLNTNIGVLLKILNKLRSSSCKDNDAFLKEFVDLEDAIMDDTKFSFDRWKPTKVFIKTGGLPYGRDGKALLLLEKLKDLQMFCKAYVQDSTQSV